MNRKKKITIHFFIRDNKQMFVHIFVMCILRQQINSSETHHFSGMRSNKQVNKKLGQLKKTIHVHLCNVCFHLKIQPALLFRVRRRLSVPHSSHCMPMDSHIFAIQCCNFGLDPRHSKFSMQTLSLVSTNLVWKKFQLDAAMIFCMHSTEFNWCWIIKSLLRLL